MCIKSIRTLDPLKSQAGLRDNTISRYKFAELQNCWVYSPVPKVLTHSERQMCCIWTKFDFVFLATIPIKITDPTPFIKLPRQFKHFENQAVKEEEEESSSEFMFVFRTDISVHGCFTAVKILFMQGIVEFFFMHSSFI